MHSDSASQKTFDLRKFSCLVVYVIFFAVLNETVFNVSTPKIAEQFHLQPSEVSWVVTTFIITFGLGQVIFGKLADIYDLRRLIVIGFSMYAAASLVGMLLQAWYPLVIVSRAVQGAGASALPALTMIIVSRYFTPEQRGKLFGLFTSTASFAVGVGPVIGGYVSAYFHWSLLFLIPLFTLAALPAFLRFLPKEEKTDGKGKVDVLGAVLLGAAISALVIFCTNPQWPYLLVSLLAAVWFVLHVRRVPHPFVDPELFKGARYRAGVIIGFLLFGSVMGIVFVVPLMLHAMHGLSTDDIGLVMFPGAFSAVIFGTVSGHITAKRGSHFAFSIGFVLISAALLVLAGLTDKPVWLTSAVLVIMYIGFSFVQTSMAETITQSLPVHQIGVGMGFYGLAVFISGAVGTAGVASLLDSRILDVPLLPFVGRPQAHLYSNLLLIFAVIVTVSGLIYLNTFGRRRQTSPLLTR
ncbi:MFS transporter [Brevibacillus sp. H7]|uniref:MFS transporter n=1 Tax=Brevibacillus sp. H7 TaxID=3349138 RepID=UPI00380E8EAE